MSSIRFCSCKKKWGFIRRVCVFFCDDFSCCLLFWAFWIFFSSDLRLRLFCYLFGARAMMTTVLRLLFLRVLCVQVVDCDRYCSSNSGIRCQDP